MTTDHAAAAVLRVTGAFPDNLPAQLRDAGLTRTSARFFYQAGREDPVAPAGALPHRMPTLDSCSP
ncbi:hypothetical protein [Streptomyces sp. NPDC005828]|uniref:hypothetical protein n=1 Tax=Streptomyces sp. NPDC005828 TaxID=3157071 RepID=UPI0033C30C4C